MPNKNPTPTKEDWKALDLETCAKQVKDSAINAAKNWHAKSASKFHTEQNEAFFAQKANFAMQNYLAIMNTVELVFQENAYLHLKIIDSVKQLEIAQTYLNRHNARQIDMPNPMERFYLDSVPIIYKVEILKLSNDTRIFPQSLKKNVASELNDIIRKYCVPHLILLNVKPLNDGRYDLVIKEVPSAWNFNVM